MGTKGRRINGETGGRCPGTDRVARSVSRHRCEDEWNDQIEFQPDTRRALSSSLASRDSPALDRDAAIPTYVYTLRFATGQSFAAVIKSGIDPNFPVYDLYILIMRGTLKKYTEGR